MKIIILLAMLFSQYSLAMQKQNWYCRFPADLIDIIFPEKDWPKK